MRIRTNRKGGKYFRGRSLPIEVREEIINLSLEGRHCNDIARQLCTAHSTVSKVLSRYYLN